MEVLAARVLLQPADFETSLAFYEDTLGLHRFREFGREPARGVVFFLGGAYLEISEVPAPRARGDEFGSSDPPAGVRLWLQVRDLDAAVTDLKQRGVTLAEPPERKPWGLHEATILDPDGLPLVLVEVPGDHPMRRDIRST